MKYCRGSFQILLFGEYGDKIDTKTANSYTESQIIARQHTNIHKDNSFVINRTIYNSKDSNNKWDYTP